MRYFRWMFWGMVILLVFFVVIALTIRYGENEQIKQQQEISKILEQERNDPEAQTRSDLSINPGNGSLGGSELGDFRVSGDELGETTVDEATWEDLMSAPTLQLMYHRRVDSLKEVSISSDIRDEVGTLVDDFLLNWETFEPGETSEYANRLSPYIAQSDQSAITRRRDNSQAEGVGICPTCSVGSVFKIESMLPSSYMRVHYHKDSQMWITTQGVVRYTAQDVGEGEPYRRGYGLLLQKVAGEWKVVRAAGETIGKSSVDL